MKTALVMGITGGFGGHVARELAANGWRIRALMRDPGKQPILKPAIEAVQGDAANIDDVRRAARDVDLIVYGVNAPYPEWEDKVVPWLEVTATVAEETGATVLFPGNVYALNPADGAELEDGFDESAPANPPTRKGELRAEMEARLKQAASNGAKVVIIRCGDFIGVGAQSWVQHLLKPNRKGYTLQAASDRSLVHTYAYLPDVARVAVKLVARVDEYADFNVFHFRGSRANFTDIAKATEEVTGRPVTIGRFPWGLLKILAVFSPMMRSLVEMRYLWQSEVNLSDRKLESYLGEPVSYTPLGQALKDTGALNHPADSVHEELRVSVKL